MAQPVTVYRWDDPGAPQITGRTPAEILDVLTKCLVDGYGAKAPLGWTRPFYDGATQAAAFRNNVAAGGSGGYVKFWSVAGTNTAGANMRTQSAKSMTDINTLIQPGYFGTFAANETVLQRWALIGTATGFYFFISRNIGALGALMASGTYVNFSMFAGDFYSVIPNDAGRFVLIYQSGNSAADATTPSWFYTLDYFQTQSHSMLSCVRIYDADNFDANINYGLFGQFSPNATNASYDGAPTNQHILVPVLIGIGAISTWGATSTLDRSGVVLNNSTTRPSLRGVLPGFFQSAFAGYRTSPWPTIVSINSADYWLLRNANSSPAGTFIKLGVWDDPFA